jgi:AraC-like DNA-binding protein
MDTHHVAFGENSLFTLSPGQYYLIQTSGQLTGQVLTFAEEFFVTDKKAKEIIYNYGIFYNFNKNPLLSLTTETSTKLEAITETIQQEWQADSFDKEEIIRAYLKICLIEISRIHQQPKPQLPPSHPTFIDFIALVQQHFRHSHCTEEYARQLSLTYEQLNELARKVSGYTACQLLNERVMTEARRSLLYETHKSVKEIAYELGFDDPAYFTRYFKKHNGVSPTDFKHQYLKMSK